MLLAVPATAHQRAGLRFLAPVDGERVGATMSVVVEAFRVGAGGAPAEFQLRLDGRPVDATGRVGGVFANLQLAPGSTLRMTVPVAPGSHELRITYARDPDNPQPDVVRRFVSAPVTPSTHPSPSPARRSRPTPWSLRLVGIALGAGVYLLIRRRRKARWAP